MNNRKIKILLNIGFVIIAFVVSVIIGGGRDGKGIPLFIWSYVFLFLADLFLAVRAIILKDKMAVKLNFIIVGALILFAFPALMFLIALTGGLC